MFEEKAVDKIFRIGEIGSCQSRDCLLVKVMTELTPQHPNFFPGLLNNSKLLKSKLRLKTDQNLPTTAYTQMKKCDLFSFVFKNRADSVLKVVLKESPFIVPA